MIDIDRLSDRYQTRALNASDVEAVLELCLGNALFYEYTGAKPIRAQILHDMKATPPGIDASDKAYLGFFENGDLVAVMDLIDGYPVPETAYIGFFMMNPQYQGRQIGTSIICDAATYLMTVGKTAIRLAIDKGNPQSTHFWKKNGFEVISEVDVNGWTKLVAEKPLASV